MKKGAISFAEWCEREGKPELLALYDCAANPLPPTEVSFTSPQMCHFRCPCCGIAWSQALNRLPRFSRGTYNVIKQREEVTFCPYCKGSRVSDGYNLKTVVPEIAKWWDAERNSKPPESFLPGTHEKFYLRCPKCGYALSEPCNIRRPKRLPRCPCCDGGRPREVTVFNCLEARYPRIARELDTGRNGGTTGQMILPSSHKSMWFRCEKGHRYKARVSNRTSLNRGCPICSEQERTSFPEQAIRFYLQKCTRDVRNCQNDPYTGRNVDILLPERKIAVEFNSLYYHVTVDEERCRNTDMTKAYELAQYYRVYIIAEQGNSLPVRDYPLIKVIPAPVFTRTEEICRAYDRLIFELLRTLFPERDVYPRVNILHDELLILQQYVRNTVDGSFEERYPLLAADWDPARNGTLTPGMFRPGNPHKFYWICRTCKKAYRMSLTNRLKVAPDTCPYCCRKSRHESPLLAEVYPLVRAFWCPELNDTPLSEVPVASERMGIFQLPDGKLVPVRISNLSVWLYAHPGSSAEPYLRRQWEKARIAFPAAEE